MSKLRLVPYGKLSKVAEQVGFQLVRRGATSHCVFQHPDGRTVIIPDHGAQVIVRGLLRKIVRDLRLTVDEYNDLLDRM